MRAEVKLSKRELELLAEALELFDGHERDTGDYLKAVQAENLKLKIETAKEKSYGKGN